MTGFPVVSPPAKLCRASSAEKMWVMTRAYSPGWSRRRNPGSGRESPQAPYTGGRLIVVAPAHQWLFSAFDTAIGHYRRYNKETIQAITPPGLRLVRTEYLDSIGLFASLANRLLLRRSTPTARQIAFWDRVMVRLSVTIDPIWAYRVGKSLLAVWHRPSPGLRRASTTSSEST